MNVKGFNGVWTQVATTPTKQSPEGWYAVDGDTTFKYWYVRYDTWLRDTLVLWCDNYGRIY